MPFSHRDSEQSHKEAIKDVVYKKIESTQQFKELKEIVDSSVLSKLGKIQGRKLIDSFTFESYLNYLHTTHGIIESSSKKDKMTSLAWDMFKSADIDVDNGHNIKWFSERFKDFLSKQQPVMDSANIDDEPVFTQFKHNAKGAIKTLSKEGRGVAVAALYHKEIGDIDLRWGETSDDARAKGSGLAKIIKWHPEVLNDLQGFISGLKIKQKHLEQHL